MWDLFWKCTEKNFPAPVGAFPWWKKRRQKKIKASAEAGEVDWVHDWPWKRIDFLRSRVGAYCIRPTGCHPEDGECAKRDTFSGYNDLIIRKRITFLGYLFHRWNVWRAYSIRPYRVTGKRIAFLKYNDQIIRKRDSFFGYIDLGIWKSGALPPCPYLLFFPWWKKRRQKKIKAPRGHFSSV